MAKRILAQTSPFGKVENDTYAFSLANKYKEHKNPRIRSAVMLCA